MPEVRFVDVSIRDGQLSVWAANMSIGMMLRAAPYMDEAGFDAIECSWGNPEKNMPIYHEQPFDGYRMLRQRFKKTPMRFHGGSFQSFKHVPRSLRSLAIKIAADIGAQQIRISDPWNQSRVWATRVEHAKSVGLQPIVNLAFSVSPRHTDEYYAQKAREAAALPVYRICLKDVDGLLTPDRVRTLVPTIMDNVNGIPLELHGHDTTGLGTVCALEAAKLGIHVINSTIQPLSYSGAQPAAVNLARNIRAMGMGVRLNEKPLEAVTEYWTAIAKREGFPIGTPSEYDSRQYSHQLPGAMKANLRRQLQEVGQEHRLDEVLDETGRVRVELGYPIMITPLSQFVGTQAAMNVIVGERYREVSDQVILYALGRYGGDEASSAMDPDIRAKILDRPRAKQLAAWDPPEPSLEEIRRMYGGPSVSDEDLMFRAEVDETLRRKLQPPVEYEVNDSPLVNLIEELTRTSKARYLQVHTSGLDLTLFRDDVGAADGDGQAVRVEKAGQPAIE